MFVLLVIPLLGGFLAGRLMSTKRTAMILTGALWLVASGLMIAERAGWLFAARAAHDPKNEFNVTFWIGVAVGLLGFVTTSMGHRSRSSRSAT